MNKAKRNAVIAGNWKMNKTASEAKELIDGILPLVKDADCTVIIGVPFTDIAVAVEKTAGSNVHVAAQNCHFEPSGAFTGEISAPMLKEAGVEYVILGHSERRQYFAETDETVNKRARAALSYGLKTIICVGESLDQREAGVTKDFVCGQVVAALDGMTEEDLKDEAHRQAYQIKMKALFGLDKFAFVDAGGVIYTSVDKQDNIQEYHFDHLSLSAPEISIKNPESREKKVIIAVPVDLESEGRRFVVCFMEIDMAEMLAGVSMQTQESGTTFSNIYTNTGIALSDTILGGLAVEDNLLDAMQNAEFEGGYSYGAFLSAFQSGARGEVSFTYNGIRETLAFVPVEGTNWMLTYLIRESVISDQIGSITESIIRRSILQSALTVIVLLAVFSFLA